MPVSFRNTKVNDRGRPQIVEDSFRAYANFCGIHDFKFDNLYTLGGSGWVRMPSNEDLPGTQGENGITLDASALTPGVWYYATQQGLSLPPSYVIKYHKTQHGQGAVVNYRVNNDHYIVGTLPNSYPIIRKVKYNQPSTIMSLPITTPAEADVTVAFRQIQFSSDEVEDDVWHAISMWINDRLICTHIEPTDSLLSGTIYFGLAVYGGQSATFTDVRIPEITEFAEWSSLDPGENPINGLQRAIEGRYLRYFMRRNGQLRAWRPKSSNSVLTIPDDVIDSRGESIDYRGIKTHIRQVGAYVEAEYYDRDLTARYGHRFKVENNPFILTKDECYRQARLTILRMLENSITEDFEMPFTPLIEVEDHVTTPTGQRIISGLNIEAEFGELRQNVNARTYIYGS